jgi:hypothetical protein
MDIVIFRGRPNDCSECDRWTLVRDGEDFVIQEHVKLDAILAGRPYAGLLRRMTAMFFEIAQNSVVKAKPQSLLVARDYDLTLSATNNSN